MTEITKVSKEQAAIAQQQRDIVEFAAISTLEKKLRERKKILMDSVNDYLGEEGDSKTASFDLDGQKLVLGNVKRSQPVYHWAVTDEQALTEWAKESAPEMVETVVVLNAEAVADLLKAVTRQNGAFVPSTGEAVPGVGWVAKSSPSTRFTAAKDIDRVFELLAAEGRLGELTGGGLGIEP